MIDNYGFNYIGSCYKNTFSKSLMNGYYINKDTEDNRYDTINLYYYYEIQDSSNNTRQLKEKNVFTDITTGITYALYNGELVQVESLSKSNRILELEKELSGKTFQEICEYLVYTYNI